MSELTSQITRVINTGMPASVLVRGEVSNFNRNKSSGHLYFTLKDSEACLDCVMFRSDAMRLKFQPEDGMELLTGGRVGVYPQRGRTSFTSIRFGRWDRGRWSWRFSRCAEA